MLKLNVPFSEKDEAKRAGALWEPSSKKWYIPRNKYSNIKDFNKWISLEITELTQVLYAPIFLVQTTKKCWKCGKDTEIYAIANKANDSVFSVLDCELDEGIKYLTKDDYYYKKFGFQVRFLSYVKEIGQDDLITIKKVASNYQRKYSQTVKHAYYGNVCKHCNMLQGDFNLYQEPDEGFIIIYEEKHVNISIIDEKYDLLFTGETVAWQ